MSEETMPSTIRRPETFSQKAPAGFDGVFDWSWTDGCFGQTRIKPMDLDGMVERKGNFLVFETKDEGVEVPDGQMYTLKALYATGHFTIIFVYGKRDPQHIEVWHPAIRGARQYEGRDKAREVVSRWFAWAERNPANRIDHTVLNRRVQALRRHSANVQSQLQQARAAIDRAMSDRPESE